MSNTATPPTSILTPTFPPTNPFKPCTLFFYGSLMDPDVLKAITALPALPSLIPATLTTGFVMKMWGPYPTLLPTTITTAKTIPGMIWKCESEDQFKALQRYETEAYTWTFCDVKTKAGDVKGCRTFCWSGKRDSMELKQGNFDIERWQKERSFGFD